MQSRSLRAKAVLISGTDKGIGLEMVKQFLRLPNPPTHLFACGLSPETSSELLHIRQEHSRVKLLKMDVRDMSSIDSAAEQVEQHLGESGLNLLINVAGILVREKTIEDVAMETMREHYRVNCIGPAMVVKRFLPLLRRASRSFEDSKMSASRAAIVNLSSGWGSLTNNHKFVQRDLSYKCSKAALNMVTKNLSIELEPDRILCVCVTPGWVRTEMGGPEATLSTEESVEHLITFMATRTEEHNGHFFTHAGELLPW